MAELAMAGHSHWKNIKRKKAVVDARRGQAWSKVARIVEGLEGNDDVQNVYTNAETAE